MELKVQVRTKKFQSDVWHTSISYQVRDKRSGFRNMYTEIEWSFDKIAGPVCIRIASTPYFTRKVSHGT